MQYVLLCEIIKTNNIVYMKQKCMTQNDSVLQTSSAMFNPEHMLRKNTFTIIFRLIYEILIGIHVGIQMKRKELTKSLELVSRYRDPQLLVGENYIGYIISQIVSRFNP